jgi:hypothetical protein
MNTLCMKMTAKAHAADGRKHRKIVLREMKSLEKRIAAHARAHVEILKQRRAETGLTEPQAQLIITRIDNVLEERGIGNGLCPRNVSELAAKLADQESFREGLKRRAATEGRIGIFKNVFLRRPLLVRGFAHRELAAVWAVLTHNLWVVARMVEAEKKRKQQQAEQPEACAA